MATRRSSIGADLVIDRRKFKAALAASQNDAKAFARSLEAMQAPRRGPLAGEGFSNKWSELGGKVSVAKAAIQGVQVVMDKLSEPQKVEMEFESALASLAAASDGTETLKKQVEELSKLGDKPGLGFQQVMEASPGLQAVGLNSIKARKAMQEFGNAVSLSGGNKFAFAEVIESVSKSLARGKVDMEQVDVISARVKMFRGLMSGLDRTNAAEFFDKILERLGELPRAATTAEEAMSNLDDAWRKAYLKASDGKLVANLKKRVEEAVAQLGAGPANILTAKLAEIWGGGKEAVGVSGNAPNLTDLYQPNDEELKRRKDVAEKARLSEKAAIEAAAAATKKKLADEGLAEQQELTDISAQQLKIEEARAAKDDKKLARLEQELRMMTEGKEIMEKTGLAADVVAKHLQQRAADEKKISDLKAMAGQADFAKAAGEDLDVARLRSRGKNKQADKLVADRTEQARVQELMSQGGLSEDAARKMAGDERGVREDEEYLQRTGRRKGKGGNYKTGFMGLAARKPSGQTVRPDGTVGNDTETGMVSEWNFDSLDRAKYNSAKYNPTKAEMDRAAGKPSITPDKFSGMTIKQADEMLKVMREIRDSNASNAKTVGERVSPKSNFFD